MAVRGPSLVALAMALPVLAGCLAGDDAGIQVPSLIGIGPDGLQENTFYQFAHPGGPLTLSVPPEGSATLDLYGADDRRLGRLQIGGLELQPRSVELQGLPAGHLVLRIESLEGTLALRTPAGPIDAFAPLPVQVERVVLIDRDHDDTASLTGALLFPDRADETKEVAFSRPPSGLRVLASGSFEDLRVTVDSARGTVMEVEAFSAGQTLPLFQERRLWNLGEATRIENVDTGAFTVKIEAQHLDGDLLLEADMFSRARIPAEVAATPAQGEAPFTYGVVPDSPVLFQVSPSASVLYLWAEVGEDDDPAYVSLYTPDDALLGTFHLGGPEPVQVPVPPGAHVAVAKQGVVYLGSDVAPVDFELHPLETRTVAGPEAAAGRDGEYGAAEAVLEPEGVLYGVRHHIDDTFGPSSEMLAGSSCGDSTIQVRQRGETLGGWGDRIPNQMVEATLRVAPGPVTVHHDDFGDGPCGRQAVELLGYVRP